VFTDYARLLEALSPLRESESPLIVAVGGHGGSGKSTTAARLAADLGGVVVGTDGLYAADAGSRSTLCQLHDWDAILDLLRRLRTADRLTYRMRTYSGQERVRDEPLPPVVVVEGIRLIRPEVLALVDVSVWLDCPVDEAGERAKQRNRLQGDEQSEIDLWDTKWIPEGRLYEKMINPAGLVDHVLCTSTPRSRPGGMSF